MTTNVTYSDPAAAPGGLSDAASPVSPTSEPSAPSRGPQAGAGAVCSIDDPCVRCKRDGWVTVVAHRGAVEDTDWEYHCTACGHRWWGGDPAATPAPSVPAAPAPVCPHRGECECDDDQCIDQGGYGLRCAVCAKQPADPGVTVCEGCWNVQYKAPAPAPSAPDAGRRAAGVDPLELHHAKLRANDRLRGFGPVAFDEGDRAAMRALLAALATPSAGGAQAPEVDR